MGVILGRTEEAARRNAARVHLAVLWLCLLSVALQQVWLYSFVFYIHTARLSSYSVVLRSACVAPVFLAAVLVLPATGLRQVGRPWRGLLIWSGVVFAIGVVFGLFNGHTARYLMGDAFRYLTPWLVLYLAVQSGTALASLGQERSLLKVLDAVVVLAVVDLGVTLLLHLGAPGLKVWTSSFVFLAGWGFLQRRRSSFVAVPLALAAVLASLVTGRRANLLAVGAVVAVIWYYKLKCFNDVPGDVAAIFLGVGTLAVIGWYAVPKATFERSREKATVLIDQSYGAMVAGPLGAKGYEGRLNEARNVRSYYDGRPEEMLFGAGFGAEFRMKWETGCGRLGSRPGYVHQIHSGWVAYYFRNGILGVLVLLAVAWCGTVGLRPRVGCPYWREALVCVLLHGRALVVSVSHNYMLEDVMVPLMIGLAVGFRALGQRPTQRDELHGWRSLAPMGGERWA